MKKAFIFCYLFLTLGYASSLERETIDQTENSELNEIENYSFSEFLNMPIEEL